MTTLTILLFVLLVLGVPIGFAFSLITITKADAWNIDSFIFATIPFDTLMVFPLLAIPLFILVGELMNHGGLVSRLADICDMFMGAVRARMGYVLIAASAFMGAITGSSVATVAAIGGTLGQAMRDRGYHPDYVAALNASSGLLGVLVPPSIPLILYGTIVGVSVTKLFMAAFIPGILFAGSFAAVHWFLSKRALPNGVEADVGGHRAAGAEPLRLSVVLGELKRSVSTLVLPVLVLGGIYGGIFTATEAAAVAGVYVLLVIGVSRSVKFPEFRTLVINVITVAAAILAIIAFTAIFNKALILQRIPQQLAILISGITTDPLFFLLIVNLTLIPVGMFMETNAATMLMGPLLAPIALQLGVDPVHFGIVMVTNIELGLMTPPMAANLYVAQKINKANLTGMIRYGGWFLGAAAIVQLIVTYVPALTTWYRFF